MGGFVRVSGYSLKDMSDAGKEGANNAYQNVETFFERYDSSTHTQFTFTKEYAWAYVAPDAIKFGPSASDPYASQNTWTGDYPKVILNYLVQNIEGTNRAQERLSILHDIKPGDRLDYAKHTDGVTAKESRLVIVALPKDATGSNASSDWGDTIFTPVGSGGGGGTASTGDGGDSTGPYLEEGREVYSFHVSESQDELPALGEQIANAVGIQVAEIDYGTIIYNVLGQNVDDVIARAAGLGYTLEKNWQS